MIRNYFTISLRNLVKRKGYTVLNILGLTIGIACCLLIFQYVSRERSYDTFQKNTSRIVRLRLDQYKQGKLSWQSATSYAAIAPTMKRELPEVENACRLIDDELLLSNDQRNIRFSETKGYYADPSAIDMLSVDMVKGSSTSALSAPFTMIVSESMAKKYFGTDDVVGKILTSRTTAAPSLIKSAAYSKIIRQTRTSLSATWFRIQHWFRYLQMEATKTIPPTPPGAGMIFIPISS